MFLFLFSFPADDIQPWWIWGYWTSPMMYGQNAIALNEFLDDRWNTVKSSDTLHPFVFIIKMPWLLLNLSVFFECYRYENVKSVVDSLAFFVCFLLQPNNDTRINATTVGEALLKSRSLFVHDYWFWISVGALIGFSLVFNICFIAALTYLNRKPLLPIHYSCFLPSN